MPNLADGAAPWFTEDHRNCDRLWADVEGAVDDGNDDAAQAAHARFDAAMSRHLDMEEQVLFPALEAAGMPRMGPIHVMLMEHDQMRGVLRTMAGCADAGDWEGVADHGDTLLMLIQQHNVKEEAVLYPMAERLLGPRWPELSEKLARY